MSRPKNAAHFVGRSRREEIATFGGKFPQGFGEFANEIASLRVPFERSSGEGRRVASAVGKRRQGTGRTFFAFPKSEGNEKPERGGTFFFGKGAKIIARLRRERGDDLFGRFFGQKGERAFPFAAVFAFVLEETVVFLPERFKIFVAQFFRQRVAEGANLRRVGATFGGVGRSRRLRRGRREAVRVVALTFGESACEIAPPPNDFKAFRNRRREKFFAVVVARERGEPSAIPIKEPPKRVGVRRGDDLPIERAAAFLRFGVEPFELLLEAVKNAVLRKFFETFGRRFGGVGSGRGERLARTRRVRRRRRFVEKPGRVERRQVVEVVDDFELREAFDDAKIAFSARLNVRKKERKDAESERREKKRGRAEKKSAQGASTAQRRREREKFRLRFGIEAFDDGVGQSVVRRGDVEERKRVPSGAFRVDASAEFRIVGESAFESGAFLRREFVVEVRDDLFVDRVDFRVRFRRVIVEGRVEVGKIGVVGAERRVHCGRFPSST